MARFPSDSLEGKERRALKAALHVSELAGQLGSVTNARFRLEGLFNVSERQIRRVEMILAYPEIVKAVLKGSVSITNASHVIENAGVSMLRIAWECAPETDRQQFLEEVRARREEGASS
jgi:hypothetical protein